MSAVQATTASIRVVHGKAPPDAVRSCPFERQRQIDRHYQRNHGEGGISSGGNA